jgi:ribosomal protein S18 acetylase RimI-like enzyme
MPSIRAAVAADVATIRAIVNAAYGGYIGRAGKPPGPMLDDYDALVADGSVSVLEADGQIAGALVLLPQEGYLLLDNVAVAPGFQGRGLGRALIAFAEDEGRRFGFDEVRLYTHVLMTENQALYTHLGFEETHRGEQDGYERVFMRKRLTRPRA